MSRKTPLTCQTKKVNIVIRKEKAIPLNKLKEFCIEYFERFAFIEHKNDIQPDTGELESVHYHIVGDYKFGKTPLSTRINQIVQFFRFDNANGIQIEQYHSFESSLQYLTHKNQSEKTQHSVEDIIHNLPQEEFNILYNAECGNVITFDLLFTSCMNANNIIEVIKQLGIGNYRIYRNVVWDIWNTLKEKEDYIK